MRAALHAILEAVFTLAVVEDVRDGVPRLAEERRERLEVRLLPTAVRGSGRGTGAVDAQAQERPRHANREFLRVGRLLVVVVAGRDEVHRRLVGVQSLRRDHLPHDLGVRRVLQQFVGEPREIAALAVGDERAVLRADVSAREPVREVVGEAAVVQEVIGPAVESRLGRLRLELADLFERRHTAGERERQPPRDREVVRPRGRRDAALLPVVAERLIDPPHDRAELVLESSGRGRSSLSAIPCKSEINWRGERIRTRRESR